MADLTCLASFYASTRWDLIWKLLPSTGIGLVVGSQLVGSLEEYHARLLIGVILLALLLLNLWDAIENSTAREANIDMARVEASRTETVDQRQNQRRAANCAVPPTPDTRVRAIAGSKTGANPMPEFAKAAWFAWVIGGVGGFATMLTNSMGPALNGWDPLLFFFIFIRTFISIEQICSTYVQFIFWRNSLSQQHLSALERPFLQSSMGSNLRRDCTLEL